MSQRTASRCCLHHRSTTAVTHNLLVNDNNMLIFVLDNKEHLILLGKNNLSSAQL